MTEQWQELKETITEMRDNGGTGTQRDVCKFLANLMETLEKQMQEPMRDATEEERKSVKDYVESTSKPTGFNFYEAQPSEDCISRQKALDCFEQTNTRQGAKYAIETLPSVTPERPKGKWIEDTQTGFKIRCSECGARNFGADRAYCPRCGSYNGGGEDGEDSACG